MKVIIRQIEKEIERRESELVKLRGVRSGLASLIPGHPYGRPKATIVAVKVVGKKRGPYKKKTAGKVHWTKTAAGKAKLARSMKAMWKRKREAKKANT